MNNKMYSIFFEIQKNHWWFVIRKNIVLDFIDRFIIKKDQMKVLDIGCGSGLMLNSLSDVGQTFGMDMSDEAIIFSKEISNCRVEKGALPDQLPYQESFFDLVTALDVIEHIDNDIDSIKAIHTLLVPGGKAIFTVPAYMFLWSAHDEVNHHKRRYTLRELNEKLVQADFTVEKITYYNTFLFPVIFLVRMLNNILNRDGASDMDMPGRVMNCVLKKIFSFEKYLLRYFDLPFGVSVLAIVRK